MQPQKVVAPLQGIAGESVEIEPATASDEYPLIFLPAVVQALEVVAPLPVLVDFVKESTSRAAVARAAGYDAGAW